MAKAKGQKNAKNAKSHLKARMNFLDKAARHLQTAMQTNAAENTTSDLCDEEMQQPTSQRTNAPDTKSAKGHQQSTTRPLTNLSRVYLSQMRGVSLKTLTRLPIPVKRSYCKRCDTPLTSGSTCVQEIQNSSRERKKPWADVLVVRCLVCGTEKRFPQTERKSKKLVERRAQAHAQLQLQTQAQTQVQEGAS
ncbi:hypothetical protein N7532_002747 [Penicillium argentinense]|uniref:Rpr2-domain-containing protein n=1 Tax=Penicillium argentinense TaxID=1131581 RepID=A0A9W9KLT2_9EURO|nr:uncharacterized protein N7532_002747 [Penicillium argentinense]KAJ5110102.1 hypothetical protein N7532_002747 [Penicillium argentinense]